MLLECFSYSQRQKRAVLAATATAASTALVSREDTIEQQLSSTACLIEISEILALQRVRFFAVFIQIEKITCESMGGAKSFAMKCFGLV